MPGQRMATPNAADQPNFWGHPNQKVRHNSIIHSGGCSYIKGGHLILSNSSTIFWDNTRRMGLCHQKSGHHVRQKPPT
eukprot:6874234-Ditylum_brightwellii.AAC.1